MAEVDDILAEILRLRGAEYVCLADRTNGRIIGEVGNDDPVRFPGGVVRLERMTSDILGLGADDELEDLMISSRYRYHLIRHVDPIGAPPLLLYLRLQRKQANLAVARRELASAELNNLLVSILRRLGGDDHEEDGAPTPAGQPGGTTRDERPPDSVLLPLPRRAPAAFRAGQAGRKREPEPDEPVEVPPVLRQSWAFDRGSMERLVHGLRRMLS